MTFFTRFAVRNTFGTDAMSAYGPYKYDDNGSYQAMDQYGIKYTNGNWKYSLGRQSVVLGQGLILGTGNDVEWDNKFNGLVASTKIGPVDVNVAGGMTNASAVVGGVANQWYGADLKSKIGDKVSLGFAYAHSKPDGSNAVPYAAVNSTLNVSNNFAVNAEYVKSDVADNNKAYTVGGTYSFGKDSLTAQYFNIGNKAVDAWNSGSCRLSLTVLGTNADIGNSMRGWNYFYSHPLNKTSSLNFYYISVTTPGYSGHDNEGFMEWQARFQALNPLPEIWAICVQDHNL